MFVSRGSPLFLCRGLGQVVSPKPPPCPGEPQPGVLLSLECGLCPPSRASCSWVTDSHFLSFRKAQHPISKVLNDFFCGLCWVDDRVPVFHVPMDSVLGWSTLVLAAQQHLSDLWWQYLFSPLFSLESLCSWNGPRLGVTASPHAGFIPPDIFHCF